MLECDRMGNNPLHFAFRTKRVNTLDLIIRAGYGDIDHRNQQGQTPKETTHNTVMDEKTKKLLGQFDPTSQRPREADYLFVADANRCDVLIDQFKSLKLDNSDPNRIDYRIFRHTLDPENKVIVLVFFNDEILNKEAERQGL